MASTSVPPPPVVRRNYLVDRQFQLKYASTLAIVGAAVSSVFGVLMILTEMESLRPLYAVLPPDGIAALRQVERTQLWMTVLTALLMAVSLGVLGVLVTHRIAGPVYVLGRYVSVLARGRYPMMRPLRKRDELKVFFQRFREAIESMRTREEGEIRELDDVLSQLPDPESDAGIRLKALRDRKRDVARR